MSKEVITGKIPWQELEAEKVYGNGKTTRRIVGFGKWPFEANRSLTKTTDTSNCDVAFVEEGSDKRRSVTVRAFLNWMRRGLNKKKCPACNGTGTVKKKKQAPKKDLEIDIRSIKFDYLYQGSDGDCRLIESIVPDGKPMLRNAEAELGSDKVSYSEWTPATGQRDKGACTAQEFLSWMNEGA